MIIVDKESVSKTLEALAYIAENLPTRKDNMYNVLRTLYLADKCHMENFGRFIFDENYLATAEGSIPSIAYNLIQSIKKGDELPYNVKPTVMVREHTLIPTHQTTESTFRKSDLFCIDGVIVLNEEALKALSYDIAWENTERGTYIPIEAIISTLSNREALLDLYYLNSKKPYLT